MRNLIFCLLFTLLSGMGFVFAQCPGADSLKEKLDFVNKIHAGAVPDRLNELLALEDKTKNCPVVKDSVYAGLLHTIGNLYFELSNHPLAIQYTHRAIDLFNTMGERVNKSLAHCYYDLSVYYDSTKLISKKNEAIDSCIATEMRMGNDYYYSIIALSDKVKYLYYKGEYTSCLSYASLGEKLTTKYYHSTDSLDKLFFFINYQFNALYSLKHFDPAEKLIIEQKDRFLNKRNNYHDGLIYGDMAFISKSKKDFGKSIDYFLKANKAFSLTDNKEFCSQILLQIGRIYFEDLGQPGKTLKYYFKSLVYADKSDSFYMYGNIAKVQGWLKKYDSAFYYFQKAFNKIKPGINEKDLVLHIEDYVDKNVTEYVINVVLDKADIYFRQFNDEKKPEYLQKAVEVYITADRLLNNIKERQTELESKLYWPGYARRLYEHAVETSLLQNNPDEAFYFFEKSRAAVLYDQLSRQNKITNKDISDEADIKKRILQLKRKLAATEASSNQYIEIQTELLNNNEQLIRLDQIIKDRNPLYYQSFLDTSFIRLEDVRNKLLKDHKALLEIFEGDTAVYSLLITPEKTYFHKISKTDFDSTAKNYMDYLSNTVLLNRKFNNFCKTSGHLYQLLFRDYLLPAGRIIISPDGNYFPFESLITNRNYSSPEYFLSNYAVSYTYSARYLLNDFAGNSSDATGNFFGIAPVHYAPSFSLTTLKGSDQSLKEIGSYFHDPNILVAGQATKNNFLRQYAGYKIIQLYTHASDTSVNGEPVIHFADSALYLSDLISETKPQARLIVLSACETGNGQLYLGEGVFSFNRGFASLGIPSSIINLWSVDNQSTYRITELFYKYLSEGMPMDIALQKAKQEFFLHASKEQRLPYYWAAAIVAGKADVLHFEKKPSWKRIVYIGAVCIGLFILVFLILRWNKRLGR